MKQKQTLGDCKVSVGVKVGYEDFFAELMKIVHQEEVFSEAMAEKLKVLALDFPNRYDLNVFDIQSDNRYERSYIGKDSSGWEAIIMTWRKGKRSTIHSHPQFAAYNILKGKLRLEIFEENADEKLSLLHDLEVEDGNGFYSIGQDNNMKNHIHRISCLDDISYSLHIYSDDARKGFSYGE